MKSPIFGLISIKSLLDNYRSLTIISALLTISLCASAQSARPYDSLAGVTSPHYDTTRNVQPINSDGFYWTGKGKFGGGLIPPLDTFRLALKDSGAIAYKGRKSWQFDGKYWRQQGSGSSDTVRTLFSPDSSISLTYNTDRDTINAVGNRLWRTRGNAGTNHLTDFLGTTDNEPLYLRVNNDTVAKFGTTSSNIALGIESYASSNSISIGNSSAANGIASFVLGTASFANGYGSLALGVASTANGIYSTSIGQGNISNGSYSISMGSNSVSYGDYSSAIGIGIISKSSNSFIIGTFNDTTGTSDGDNVVAFQIGNGIYEEARSNILTVLQSGNVGIGTTTPSARLHVVAPDTNVAKLVGLGNTVLATDSALVIDTDGNVKKAAKSSGGGVTTGQLTDSLNARGDTYKLKSDSTGNSGYTTLYQRNKAKDSLQTNINLKAPLASPTFTGTLNAAGIIASSASVFSTSLRTPVLIGNTSTSGTLTLRSTSGVGGTDAIIMQVGNYGGTEALRIINSGKVGIGTTTPAEKLEVAGGIKCDSLKIGDEWFYTKKVTIDSSQINHCFLSPVQLIANPGTGKAIKLIDASFKISNATTGYTSSALYSTGLYGGVAGLASFNDAEVLGSGVNNLGGMILQPNLIVNESITFSAQNTVSDGDGDITFYLYYRITTL